jgi:hypothetical protein
MEDWQFPLLPGEHSPFDLLYKVHENACKTKRRGSQAGALKGDGLLAPNTPAPLLKPVPVLVLGCPNKPVPGPVPGDAFAFDPNAPPPPNAEVPPLKAPNPVAGFVLPNAPVPPLKAPVNLFVKTQY